MRGSTCWDKDLMGWWAVGVVLTDREAAQMLRVEALDSRGVAAADASCGCQCVRTPARV
jgi:hypothetical protein